MDCTTWCQCMFQLLWRCLHHCKESCDQNYILHNNSKFLEERNHWSSGGCSGGGRSHISHNCQGCRNYKQNKLQVVNPACHSNGGGHYFDDVWMAYYGKNNIWSGATNTHSTGFHDAFLLAGTNYHLPKSHPFHHHCSVSDDSIWTSTILQLQFQGEVYWQIII